MLNTGKGVALKLNVIRQPGQAGLSTLHWPQSGQLHQMVGVQPSPQCQKAEARSPIESSSSSLAPNELGYEWKSCGDGPGGNASIEAFLSKEEGKSL